MSDSTDNPAGLKQNLLCHSTLVDSLGLCPILAVSTTALAAIAMGVGFFLVLACSALTVHGLRSWMPPRLRLLTFLLVTSTWATVADLLLAAYLYPVHERLGIYVLLLAVNCLVLTRLEAVLTRERMADAIKDAVRTGALIVPVVLGVGLLRELLGTGSLFAGHAGYDGLAVLPVHVPLFVHPAGAFFALALIAAAANALRAASPAAPHASP